MGASEREGRVEARLLVSGDDGGKRVKVKGMSTSESRV